jgi:hypothetical protein
LNPIGYKIIKSKIISNSDFSIIKLIKITKKIRKLEMEN